MDPVAPMPIVETGNSRLRALLKSPLESAADNLTECYPGLSASQITFTGTVACVGAAVAAAKAPGWAPSLSWVHLAGSLTDALDGPVARAVAAKHGDITTAAGANFDAANDRLQEFSASSAQAQMAFERGDRLGGLLLLAFGVSSIFPSLTRSYAETRGIVVAEGKIGSRATRVTLNCLGYHWSHHTNGVRLMAAAGTASNLYNACTRIAAWQPGSSHNIGALSEKKQADARSRRQLLGLMTVGMAVASAMQGQRGLAALRRRASLSGQT